MRFAQNVWRRINYFLCAADLIRKDNGPNFFESDFLKNTFDYRLYQCAPNWQENINFADVHDRRSSHSICAYYKIASEYNNGHAQWLGELVRKEFLFREAYESKIFPGILPEAFLELIWYDPSIEIQKPKDLPLTKHFPDLGLVVMRSSWDSTATHLSFKSSPPGGHKQWQLSWELDKKHAWKTRSLTHYHVDFNHFILEHNGASLVVDEGYNRTSRAEIHNLITVDGTGCVGEKIWQEGDLSDPELFDLNCKGIHNVWRDVPENAIAKIEAYSSDDGYTYAVGESSKMYYPEMELTRNARHIINSECGYFILLDELESKLPHTYTWRIHSEKYAQEQQEGQFQICNGNGVLNIYSVFPQAASSRIDETIIEEIMTPQRPDDIRRISLKTLKLENSEKSKDCYFLNVLQAKDAIEVDQNNEISVKQIQSDGCIGVQVKSKNHIEVFLFSSSDKIIYGDIQSEAKWISRITDRAGNLIKSTSYQLA